MALQETVTDETETLTPFEPLFSPELSFDSRLPKLQRVHRIVRVQRRSVSLVLHNAGQERLDLLGGIVWETAETITQDRLERLE